MFQNKLEKKIFFNICIKFFWYKLSKFDEKFESVLYTPEDIRMSSTQTFCSSIKAWCCKHILQEGLKSGIIHIMCYLGRIRQASQAGLKMAWENRKGKENDFGFLLLLESRVGWESVKGGALGLSYKLFQKWAEGKREEWCLKDVSIPTSKVESDYLLQPTKPRNLRKPKQDKDKVNHNKNTS